MGITSVESVDGATVHRQLDDPVLKIGPAFGGAHRAVRLCGEMRGIQKGSRMTTGVLR